jgi:hypothetical protein
VIALIWLFITLGIANFYPLIDGGITKIWIVLKDNKARGKAQLHGASNSSSDHDSLGRQGASEVIVEPKHG